MCLNRRPRSGMIRIDDVLQMIDSSVRESYLIDVSARVAHPVRITRAPTAFQRLLHPVFGYPNRRKAWSIRLPDLLYTAHATRRGVRARVFRWVYSRKGPISGIGYQRVWGRTWTNSTPSTSVRVRRFAPPQSEEHLLYRVRNLERMPLFSDPEKVVRQRRLEGRAGTSYVVDLLPSTGGSVTDRRKSRFYMTAARSPRHILF